MPDLAEERRLATADGRYFTVEPAGVLLRRRRGVHGTLDVADAQDLETAVAAVAAQLKGPRSEESLDVRRALAVGELARAQIDTRPEPTSSSLSRPPGHPGRSSSTSTSPTPPSPGAAGDRPPGARQQPGHRRPGPRLVRRRRQHRRETGDRPRGPRPGRVTVVPDRRAELVALRDKTCVFPGAADPPDGATRTTPSRTVGRADVSVQSRALVPATPPDQDPRTVVLPDHRARHLPVDLQARLPVPPRHHRHPDVSRDRPRPPD